MANTIPNEVSGEAPGWPAAAAIVIGNMVGIGVFTSLGYQLTDISSNFSILLLWVIGGIYAICGALCYGELVASKPRCGGEYHLLSSIYHPGAGFLAGWISVTVGFAAPIAAACGIFGIYFVESTGIGDETGKIPAVIMLVTVTSVHLLKLKVGGAFQIIMTALKFGLVLLLAVCGIAMGDAGSWDFSPGPYQVEKNIILSSGFAVALFYVNYAFAGWNAATYVAGEIKNPSKNIPRALLIGTVSVLLLYLLINIAFIVSTPKSEMVGKEEVGLIAARYIFGQSGGNLIGGLIAFGLISAVSAMTWAGPRVTQMIGQDYGKLRFFAKTNKNKIPVNSVLFQSCIAFVMLLSVDPDQIIIYLEFVLNLSLSAAVAGVIWLRLKRPDLDRPYRCLGYPLTPILFLCMAIYVEWRLIETRPIESLWGLGTVLLGAVFYFLVRDSYQEPQNGKG
ncbi:MAG: amino acid permease [Verrucomicrobiales bacterium]|nr:amino acid permease [Verrucomicrobiales bacterium]